VIKEKRFEGWKCLIFSRVYRKKIEEEEIGLLWWSTIYIKYILLVDKKILGCDKCMNMIDDEEEDEEKLGGSGTS
jgi:hypothetical protein